MVSFALTAQKAIVTGGSGGIGKAIVDALLEAGAEVCIIDLVECIEPRSEGLSALSSRTHFVKADLVKDKEIDRAFQEAVQTLGGQLDILVNCAGINIKTPAEQVSLEDWEKVLQINVTAMFRMCQKAGQIMLPQEHGKIINIASICSFVGSQNNACYSTSKGAVAQLTKALSNEWAPYGIQVNAIASGTTLTKFTQNNSQEMMQRILAHIPAGRLGKPEDMQGPVVFLASHASDYVTGVVLPVDGGYLCV